MNTEMKVMDVEMESDECKILEAATPPKQKKLKQARLPFQMLTSSVSPNVSTKKRKLSSPSPVSARNPKVQKVVKKENSLKTVEIIDVESSNDKDEERGESETNINATGSPDTLGRSKDKKPEGKGSMKPGALTRFLQKAPAAAPKPAPPPQESISNDEIKQPIIVLDRCDNKLQTEGTTVSNDSVGNSSKLSEPKLDESSNDCLAEPLSDSDKEGNQNSLDKTQETESESESEISPSEDETQEDRKSNEDSEDNEEGVNDEILNKTPQADKTAEMLALKRRKLTPKQLEKKMESAKKREERDKLKAEREKQRIQEKLKRRKEHEDRRKERRERKEAENELKKKEREQKELKKQMDIEQKQKEREQKEKAKEDEKRKKEEEKIEAEKKKQKAASTFVSFFVAKKQENKPPEEEKPVETSNFMPFEIKADMKVAPICRRNLSVEAKLTFDSTCLKNEKSKATILWLDEIRKNKNEIRKSGKTWPAETKDDIVVMEEDDVGSANVVDEIRAVTENQRAKLLLFTENRRPPYWGTWRKKSEKINPKNPFIKDTNFFDYDVDSDEEWEEEEPGESLRGSDDEKEEENADADEYDVDNDFMVPHGYLSDSEALPDEEDQEDTSPETQKFKLKILGEQFEAEMNAKTAKIKPRVIGCIWQDSNNSYPENVSDKLIKFLMARQAWVRETPIVLTKPAEPETSNNPENSNEKSLSLRGSKKTKMPDEALPHLIKLIHGNNLSRPFLVKEFITFWNRRHSGEGQLSKASVANKIGELAKRIACPEEGPMHLKNCWYVSEETRKKYLEETLTLPNQWSYILTPKRRTTMEESSEKPEKEGKEKPKESEKIKEKEPKEKDRKSAPLITQFTQKITQEEMKKQLTVCSSPKSVSTLNRPPKRASLISVARGEQFPKASNIVTAFSKITENSKSNASDTETSAKTITLDSDTKKNSQLQEVICIDDSSNGIDKNSSEGK